MAWIQTLPAGPRKPKRYKVHYTTPAGGKTSEVFLKAHQARGFAGRVEVEKIDGAFIDRSGGKVTLAEYASRLLGLEGAAPEWHRLEPTTLDSWRRAARLRILPGLGEYPLAKLTAERVRTWHAELHAAPKAKHRAIELARTVLHRIMAQAITDGRVKFNPVAAVPPAKKPPRLEPVRIPTPAEVEALAAAIEPRYRAWVYVCAYTGLRFGESAGLLWSNVDTTGRRLRVVHNRVEVTGRSAVRGPKNGPAAVRWVDYPDVVADALERHAAAYPPGPAGEVFTMPEGGPLARSSWRSRYWVSARDAAKVQGVTPHGLRHYAASVLIAAGASPKAVAEFLGDSSVAMVMRTYAHLFPSAGRTMAEAMDRFRAEALAKVTPIRS